MYIQYISGIKVSKKCGRKMSKKTLQGCNNEKQKVERGDKGIG